jgi:hypothetical protein
MTNQERPFVWQMVREAVAALGHPAAQAEIRDWILAKYPGTNRSTIACQTTSCTVNDPSRMHFPENKRPRVADGPRDVLFRETEGIVLYDRAKHGPWRIIETSAGLTAVEAGTEEDASSADQQVPGQAFAAEAHLHDYLYANLEQIEEGLEPYVEGDSIGCEFQTIVGRIDILAVDRRGNLLVIELKLGKTPDKACGQLMRYMSWIKRHVANGRPVQGMLIGQFIPDTVRFAIADLQNVEAREYELSLKLSTVPHIDAEAIRPTTAAADDEG